MIQRIVFVNWSEEKVKNITRLSNNLIDKLCKKLRATAQHHYVNKN